MLLPMDGEIVWERQSSGKWRQTPAPRFRQNADRVKVRSMIFKTVFTYTCSK